MSPRAALLPGTTLEDPTYDRALAGLAGALPRLGWNARAFCPRRGSPRSLAAFAPDVVNLHFSGHLTVRAEAWLARARRAGAAMIVTFQDMDHPDLPPPTAGQRERVAALLRGAAAVTALTPELARNVRRGYGVTRVRVIGNGVGPEWFSRAAPRGRVIVAPARLAPYKGIDLTLWAFAELARSHREPRLAVLGRDFQSGHHRRLARLLRVEDRVNFAGELGPGRLRRALAGAALVVSASRRETYGMAVLEALAAGAPVLAARTGVAKAALRHNRTAWLVPPGDAAALARGLARLWEDAALRRRLGGAGRRLATAHTWSARATAYAAVYREALSA